MNTSNNHVHTGIGISYQSLLIASVFLGLIEIKCWGRTMNFENVNVQFITNSSMGYVFLSFHVILSAWVLLNPAGFLFHSFASVCVSPPLFPSLFNTAKFTINLLSYKYSFSDPVNTMKYGLYHSPLTIGNTANTQATCQAATLYSWNLDFDTLTKSLSTCLKQRPCWEICYI